MCCSLGVREVFVEIEESIRFWRVTVFERRKDTFEWRDSVGRVIRES